MCGQTNWKGWNSQEMTGLLLLVVVVQGEGSDVDFVDCSERDLTSCFLMPFSTTTTTTTAITLPIANQKFWWWCVETGVI
jgi:cellulase/cellobiase CelA1